MENIRVAVDLDMTLWNLVEPWLAAYNEITNESVTLSDIKSYQIADYVQHPEILPYILETDGFWETVCLYDGVYEAVEKMKQNPKIDLIIATATNYKVAPAKFHRLFELLPMLDEKQLVIAARKDLLAVDFLIDDWESNLRDVEHVKYTTPILITQPYNEAFPDTLYGIKRAKNFVSAAAAIEKYVTAHMFNLE